MFAVLVPVPVATMDEDDRLLFRQDDIGTAGELFIFGAVDREAKAAPVKHGPKKELGLGRVKGCAPRDHPRIRDMTQLRFPLSKTSAIQ